MVTRLLKFPPHKYNQFRALSTKIMTELLKHLEENDESSIPLLPNEIDRDEGGLFTDEEIRTSERKKFFKSTLKLIILIMIFIGVFVFASFKTYRYISYNLKNQKIDYKLHSISVKNASNDGFALSLNATVDANVPWSLDVRGITLEIMKGKDSIVSAMINGDFDIVSGESIPIVLSNQSVEIKDPESLAKLINKSVKDKKIKVPLRISTTVHPHWIPYTFNNIQIEKEIELDLNRGIPNGDDVSKYVNLIDLKMEEAANDDLIITAKLKITNPLPFSIDQIPPVSFKIYSKDEVFIGKVRTLETIRLKKNSSTLVKLQGHLSPSSDPKTSDAIGELVTNHLMGKSSKIYLRGDEEAFPNGNLNWLQSILIHLNVPIIIPGSKKSLFKHNSRMFDDSIKRIDVKKINFKLDPNKPDQIALDSDAEVHFNVPRFAKMMKPTIESLSLEGRVSDQGGNFIAPIVIPNHHVGSSLSNQNSLNTKMKLDINVNHMNLANVESLMAEMLYAQDTTVSIAGHSSVKTKLFLGKINVPRVPFSADIKLPGLGRILSSQEPEINSLKVKHANNDEIVMSGKLSINNPTEITSEMGLIQMNLISEADRKHLGTVLMENVSIRPGANSLGIEIFLATNANGKEFIEKLIEKGEERIILQGVPRSELIHPILKNVIEAFVMKGKIVNTFGNFVSSIILKRKGFSLIPEAFMEVSNPFPFPMKIISVKNLHVYAYKPESDKEEMVLITEMEQVPLDEPIVIPANVENWIDEANPLPLQMNGNILRSIKALEMLLNKNNPTDSAGKKYLPTRIEAKIKSEMAGMELEMVFIKDRLPLYLELS